MVLLLVFMQLTRDLFAIAKFLLNTNKSKYSEVLRGPFDYEALDGSLFSLERYEIGPIPIRLSVELLNKMF